MEPEKRQNGLKIGCKVHKGCDVPSGFLHTAFCTFAYLIIGLSLRIISRLVDNLERVRGVKGSGVQVKCLKIIRN